MNRLLLTAASVIALTLGTGAMAQTTTGGAKSDTMTSPTKPGASGTTGHSMDCGPAGSASNMPSASGSSAGAGASSDTSSGDKSSSSHTAMSDCAPGTSSGSTLAPSSGSPAAPSTSK